jgi:hypothetical protein
VETIGGHAFLACRKLPKLVLPQSLKVIGEAAFEQCAKVASVNIPASVVSIGSKAFDGCTNKGTVYIEDLVAWCGILMPDETATPLRNSWRVFINGVETTALTIPAEVKTVNRFAFMNYYSLQSLTVSEGVEVLEWSAFASCAKLSSVTLPDSLEVIGNFAFSRCGNITSIAFGKSLVEIGGNAFEHTKLRNVVIPDNVTLLGESAFENSGLRSITLGKGITVIRKYTFAQCNSLGSVTFSGELEKLEFTAFQNCRSLKSIVLPRSVVHIGDQALGGTTDLNAVYYEGTREDFLRIDITRASNPDVNINDEENFCVYFYSEVQPTEEGLFWYYDQNGKPVIWQ